MSLTSRFFFIYLNYCLDCLFSSFHFLKLSQEAIRLGHESIGLTMKKSTDQREKYYIMYLLSLFYGECAVVVNIKHILCKIIHAECLLCFCSQRGLQIRFKSFKVLRGKFQHSWFLNSRGNCPQNAVC